MSASDSTRYRLAERRPLSRRRFVEVTAGAATAAVGAWLWVPLLSQAQTTRSARAQTATGTATPVPTPRIVSPANAVGQRAFLEFPEASQGGPQPIVIAGESIDLAHPGNIEPLAAELGMQSFTTVASATSGAAANPAGFERLRITKSVDMSSPGIFLACAAGLSFPTANLYVRKAGGDEDLIYRFKLVQPTNVQTAAESGAEATQEIIDFVFGALQVEYTRPGASGPITQAWSVVSNQPVFDVTP